ncbi:hypothetical protein BRPE64_CCDS05090 [Caballeronia insecticola]|uniref:Uncharacterized protein n=1 Tax=Caballeronia insecticola TaxID=758793 RepID=R4X3Q2_9BURK|nr:hypothetical protein BRPE64_CCDS05090 [Caballeronia insecticola]
MGQAVSCHDASHECAHEASLPDVLPVLPPPFACGSPMQPASNSQRACDCWRVQRGGPAPGLVGSRQSLVDRTP